jgi:hypothetical protein
MDLQLISYPVVCSLTAIHKVFLTSHSPGQIGTTIESFGGRSDGDLREPEVLTGLMHRNIGIYPIERYRSIE